jgi:EAL and modified HD-GYP domain-containing signal transduction protein
MGTVSLHSDSLNSDRGMEVFVARHPVFDRQMESYGYELDFREGFDTYYEALDSDTAAVDFMAFVNFGELADGKRGFVNFTRSLLLKGFPVLLPKETMTAGLPADIECDDAVVSACRKLKEYGFSLALNHFTLKQINSPLLGFVDMVKVDFAGQAPAVRQEICDALESTGVKLLAMNVQTIEEFDQAVSWGYSYFHGDFFSKPVARADKEISANKLTALRVLNEVNAPELPYDEIESLIKQDVSMTYKLLRFMNSAWFGLRYEVRSIKHALIMLGPKEVKRWVCLFVVRNTGEDKPRELLVRALTRARVAEHVAPLMGMDDQSSELFLMGMFSMIDALTDTPLDEVLKGLPLTDDIKNALLGTQGQYRLVLEVLLAYEKGNWQQLSHLCAQIQVKESVLPEIFRESLRWATHCLDEL